MNVELIDKLLMLYIVFCNIAVFTMLSVYADDNGARNVSLWMKLKVSALALLFGTLICVVSVGWDLFKSLKQREIP